MHQKNFRSSFNVTIKLFLISFKNDLLSKTVGENVDYPKFEKEFIDTLNKYTTKKTKLFCGNQKPHVNKVLCSAIMKKSRLNK